MEEILERLRVLVVDDSLTIRALIEHIVNREPGCRVVGLAADVAAARRMLGDLVPNVVTLDLSMPDVDGLEFLEELRGTVHAPVVVVSSSTQLDSEKAALVIASGADAWFDKSKIVSEADQLIETLRKAVKRKSKKGIA